MLIVCVCKAEVPVSTFWMENRAVMKTHGQFISRLYENWTFFWANPNRDNLPFANV